MGSKKYKFRRTSFINSSRYVVEGPLKYTGILSDNTEVADEDCYTIIKTKGFEQDNNVTKVKTERVYFSKDDMITFKLRGASAEDMFKITLAKKWNSAII